MYKVSAEFLQRIVDALNESNLMLDGHEQDATLEMEENDDIIKLIKDNYLLDGE